MRTRQWAIAAVLVVGMAGIASAQSAATSSGTSGATAISGATTTSSSAQTSAITPQSGTHFVNTVSSHWIASGFVGSNFGASAETASVDFGGQVGYLWRGIVGGEILGDFAPRFQLNNALLANNPNVNSYMANAIVAAPLGTDARFQPYVSGGLGGIQLRSDVLNIAGSSSSGSVAADRARAGGDVGAGLMGFAGNFGFRADVRYYRAFSSSNARIGSSPASGSADAFADSLLSGLDFWRANAGVAFRW